MSSPYEQFEFDNMRSNPDNYKVGIFYFNPKDSRIILPKRSRAMGWTLNFASPYTYLILIGIVVFGFLFQFFFH